MDSMSLKTKKKDANKCLIFTNLLPRFLFYFFFHHLYRTLVHIRYRIWLATFIYTWITVFEFKHSPQNWLEKVNNMRGGGKNSSTAYQKANTMGDEVTKEKKGEYCPCPPDKSMNSTYSSLVKDSTNNISRRVRYPSSLSNPESHDRFVCCELCICHEGLGSIAKTDGCFYSLFCCTFSLRNSLQSSLLFSMICQQ